MSGVNSVVSVVQQPLAVPLGEGGLAGGGPLGVPPGGQCIGDAAGVALDVGSDRVEDLPGLAGVVGGADAVLLQGGHHTPVLLVAGDVGHETFVPILVHGQHVEEALLPGPRLTQLPQDLRKGPVLGVAGRLHRSGLGGMAGTEVGTGVLEHADPLFPRLIHGVGDEVGGVGVAAAGHPHIRRLRAGVLPDHEMGGVSGVALHPIHRARVGQLHMLEHVDGRQAPASVGAGDGEAAVRGDAGDGPGVPVRDPQGGVVAAGRDPVADPDPLPRPCHQSVVIIDSAGRDETFPDRRVQIGDLLTGIRCHRQIGPANDRSSGSVGEGCGRGRGRWGAAG